ncbi:hypothetical protein [Dyella sp. 2HG41-7]|uniref:hypothetical protein n=1 Tax=Dyella sp. 2HG41-7 TaxID=2883239 RepID=UPI001F44E6E0|nr:hypothetical protein [Dyella sp. 2HG41-7]
MKKSLTLLALVMLCIFTPMVNAGDIDRFCFDRGDTNEKVCAVPLTVLIARGEDFNGKLVLLHGYFANGAVPVLFASNEDFLTSNVENGVVVRVQKDSPIAARLFELNHRSVDILGRYDASPVDLTSYHAGRASGSISSIRLVGDAYAPWGFNEYGPMLITPKQ